MNEPLPKLSLNTLDNLCAAALCLRTEDDKIIRIPLARILTYEIIQQLPESVRNL